MALSLDYISLRVSLCSRRSSIRVQSRSVTISNADSWIGNVKVTRSVSLTLVREVLHTLPEARACIASKSTVAIADKVQVKGQILVRVVEAVEGVFGALLHCFIGGKHFGEVCDYRGEVVGVVGVSGVVGVFGVTASSVEAFVRGVTYHDGG